MKLDTVIIFTHQMERLADFYQKGLGFTGELNRSPGHLGFSLDDQIYLGFDEIDKHVHASDNGGVSLWFAVNDLDLAFQRFVQAGASVRYAKKKLPMGDTLASLHDLDGNIFGLVER